MVNHPKYEYRSIHNDGCVVSATINEAFNKMGADGFMYLAEAGAFFIFVREILVTDD